MSGTPFKTKFTVGLLTIEPCPQPPEGITDVEEKSNEVLAIEEAARNAIKERKKKKKLAKARAKSTRQLKEPKEERPHTRSLSPVKPPPLEEEPEVDEEAIKRQEEEEAARLKAEAEEAARLAAEEEARLRAEEEAACEYGMTDESMYFPMEKEEVSVASEEPKPRKKAQRRVSFFPYTPDNDGLLDALDKHGRDVPFEWEKPEWRMDFGNLKHATTYKGVYGWETPEWANKALKRAPMKVNGLEWQTPEWVGKSLRKTEQGEMMKSSSSLEKPITNIRATLMRSHSFSDRRPVWTKEGILRSTEAGKYARLGVNLNMSINDIKHPEFIGGESYQSLGASRGSIVWEKPEWAKTNKLRATEAGAAIKQGANLALPIVDIHKVVSGTPDSANLEGSFVHLNMSQKNISWEKPEWAQKNMLKRTSKGELMKEKGTLAKPISHNRNYE